MEQLQALAASLTIPGLPAWSGLVSLLLLAFVLLAWVAMPFSVFGVKSRLDMLEAQLDEIQGEIRALGMRLADEARPGPAVTTDYVEVVAPRRDQPAEFRARPPVPPPAARPEPRLDWPGPKGR